MIRTWERGAGLTKACGSAACASAVAAARLDRTGAQGDGHAARRRSRDRMARSRRSRADDRAGRIRARGPLRGGAVRRRGSGADDMSRRGRDLRLPAQCRQIGSDPPRGGTGRAERHCRRQYLRGHGGSGAPGAADHPRAAPRAARARRSSSPAVRRRSSRRPSSKCPRPIRYSAIRKSSSGRGLDADAGAFDIADSPKALVNDIMAVRQTAPHLIEGGRRPDARFRSGPERLRSSLHVLHHPLRPRQFALGADGRGDRDVRRLVANGCREIVLTGVDITSYGARSARRPKLGMLVKQILKHVPELRRLRLSSIDWSRPTVTCSMRSRTTGD